MTQPANVHRIAVLRNSEIREQCTLAIAHGPVPTVIDAPGIGPDDYIALIRFAKLGPGSLETRGGLRFAVMPVVDGPTANRSVWALYPTMGLAMARLDAKKAELLAAGWTDDPLDPVNDPD